MNRAPPKQSSDSFWLTEAKYENVKTTDPITAELDVIIIGTPPIKYYFYKFIRIFLAPSLAERIIMIWNFEIHAFLVLTRCHFIGGGISGVSTAYFLKKYGVPNVLLLESRGIASGRCRSHHLNFQKSALTTVYFQKINVRYWGHCQSVLELFIFAMGSLTP